MAEGDKIMSSETSFIEENIWGCDVYEEFEEGDILQYLQKLSEETLFADGVRELCYKHGYDGNTEDDKEIRKYIVGKALNLDVISKDKKKAFENTIDNWFKEGTERFRREKSRKKEKDTDEIKEKKEIINAPDDTIISRENVYKLCWSLELSIDEIKEFFLKKYLCMPFNLRNVNETVYFYCLNNDKTYMDAKKILDSIEQIDIESNLSEDLETQYIRFELVKIHKDDEFIDFYKKNYAYFNKSNLTVVNEIKNFVKQIEKEKNIIGCSEIIGLIFDNQSRKKTSIGEGEKEFSVGLRTNIMIPKKIRLNLPSEIQLSNILNGKRTSPDAERKMLILLDFYSFFMNGTSVNDVYGEFVIELDSILDKCGFIQSYSKNPYDLLFKYCATRDNPIDEFQRIIEQYLSRDVI